MKKRKNASQDLFESHETAVAKPGEYYSGDKPNPFLRSFVDNHLSNHPFDLSTDNYSVPSFDSPITTTKTSAVFSMHAYHLGKKPHDAIEQYVRHFTKKGDLILDPFSGSGSTALAALANERAAIAVDISPAATFITRAYVSHCSPASLEARFEELCRKVGPDIEYLYSTTCHHCRGPASIHYVIYSNAYRCPRCLKNVSLYEASQFNPPCCPYCRQSKHVDEPINSRLPVVDRVPVAVNFSCLGECKPSRMMRSVLGERAERDAFAAIDLERIRELERVSIPYAYPTNFMMNVEDSEVPWGDEWRPSRNFRRVADLFTHRNLWALAAFMNAAGADDDLRAVITAGMFAVSRKAQHLDGGGGYIPGNWALPPMSKQRNVLESLNKVFQKVLAAKTLLNALVKGRDVCISTESATNLKAIPNQSVDYIFTDPPYGGAVQYGELNFVWEAWLGLNTRWQESEIVVNETRHKTPGIWAEMMLQAMKECFRVLKPGRWLSLCYHDTSEGTWEIVQDIMSEAGFVADKSDATLFIDTGGNTYNQRVADKVTKRDLVVNYRKPKPGELQIAQVFIPANADIATFRELARQIIKDFLVARPGSTKDRIYDALISSMVRKGQMEAHDFEALLKSVADEVQEPVKEDLFRNMEPDLLGAHVQSRWYLKETADELDHAEQVKEDAAANRLGDFIAKQLNKRPELEGVHYSDLFEQYLPIHDKPRRLLADWLVEYFIKTANGTWRLPIEEEIQQLAEVRQAGTLRRIKRFANALIQGVPVRDKDRPGSDADLLDWLRQCRRSGLYEQGKAIYEKGGMNSANISDQQQIEAEDDYRICVRRGSTDVAKIKRPRRKNEDDEE